jgi:hypothetical protein
MSMRIAPAAPATGAATADFRGKMGLAAERRRGESAGNNFKQGM